jgi:hypothetical protein
MDVEKSLKQGQVVVGLDKLDSADRVIFDREWFNSLRKTLVEVYADVPEGDEKKEMGETVWNELKDRYCFDNLQS